MKRVARFGRILLLLFIVRGILMSVADAKSLFSGIPPSETLPGLPGSASPLPRYQPPASPVVAGCPPCLISGGNPLQVQPVGGGVCMANPALGFAVGALIQAQCPANPCAATAPTASTTSCNLTSANQCSHTADACQSAIKIDRSFTIQNELGPYKVTNVDVPCSLSVRKKPSKDPKAPPSYSCTPNPDMACYSGITVSAGIDLSQQSISSLNSMGINATQNAGLFNLLKPYLPPPQRTGCNAEIYLLEHPLSITATQAQTFDNLAYASYEGQVVKAFDDETGQNFELLPAQVQTTLFDYYYWHGNILALVPDIKADDWNGVVADLHAMQSKYPKTNNFYKRYKLEASKIQLSINDGSLKEYAQCLKK